MDSASRSSDFLGYDGGDSSDEFARSLSKANYDDSPDFSMYDDSPDFSMPEEDGLFTESVGAGFKDVPPTAYLAPVQTSSPPADRRHMANVLRSRIGKGRARALDTARQPRANRETTHFCTALVLIGGLIAAFTLYLAFLELSPVSLDPLGSSLLLLGVTMAALTICGVGLVLAIRGVLVGRPKHRPATAIVGALVVVPLLVLFAGTLGLNETKREVQDSAVSSAGRTFVWVLDLMVEEGVNIGPFARLLE